MLSILYTLLQPLLDVTADRLAHWQGYWKYGTTRLHSAIQAMTQQLPGDFHWWCVENSTKLTTQTCQPTYQPLPTFLLRDVSDVLLQFTLITSRAMYDFRKATYMRHRRLLSLHQSWRNQMPTLWTEQISNNNLKPHLYLKVHDRRADYPALIASIVHRHGASVHSNTDLCELLCYWWPYHCCPTSAVD